MAVKAFARSSVLNIAAALAGLGGTLFIIWVFGLAEFAYFTINMAKLSLIVLGAEVLPSSFMIFRLQGDSRFTAAVPVFFLTFAFIAAAAAATLILSGLIPHASWFMVLFVICSTTRRYFDAQAQASGRVDAFFWIPATTNITRLGLLIGLSQVNGLPVDRILWASVALGSLTGQLVMAWRFPEFLDSAAYRHPLAKLRYLWSIRRAYYGYYVNSVLKRLRDTFLPLFCDIAIPSKTEIGRLLVFTRANEAVCGQVRVLEAFMVNFASRQGLRTARRRIFWTIAPLGQLAVAAITLVLMYPQGIATIDILLALATGLFIYPYTLELFWRNDALAAYRPHRVTISLMVFLLVLAVPLGIALAMGAVGIPVVILSYVAAQAAAAATYRVIRVPVTIGSQMK